MPKADCPRSEGGDIDRHGAWLKDCYVRKSSAKDRVEDKYASRPTRDTEVDKLVCLKGLESMGRVPPVTGSFANNAFGQHWRIWIGLAVSGFFLWWAFRQARDIEGVVASVRDANYLLMVPAIGLFFVGVWFRALRWKLLLMPVQRVSTGELYRTIAIGFTVNNVLPARLGEFARAYLLSRRTSISKSGVLATIVVERVFDGITMLILLSLVALTAGLGNEVGLILQVAGAIFLISAIVLIGAALAPVRTQSILTRVLAPFPAALGQKVLSMSASFIAGLAVLQNGRLLALVLGTSVAAWFFEGCMYFLISVGFNLGVGLPAFFLTLAIVNLGTMIPSSPGYVGTFQGLTVFALGIMGVNQADALGYSVVLHAAVLIPVTVLGFYFLGRYNLGLKSLLKEQGK
jgi:glycosyltransferase 2 family protein